jgi:hypothetical protein
MTIIMRDKYRVSNRMCMCVGVALLCTRTLTDDTTHLPRARGAKAKCSHSGPASSVSVSFQFIECECGKRDET